MSEFIERSKHPELTQMAEDHIMGTNNGLPTRKGVEQDPDKGLGFNNMPKDQAGQTV